MRFPMFKVKLIAVYAVHFIHFVEPACTLLYVTHDLMPIGRHCTISLHFYHHTNSFVVMPVPPATTAWVATVIWLPNETLMITICVPWALLQQRSAIYESRETWVLLLTRTLCGHFLCQHNMISAIAVGTLIKYIVNSGIYQIECKHKYMCILVYGNTCDNNIACWSDIQI